MNRKKRYCRECWKKIRQKRYIQKHKTQIKQYFKQWYEEKGRENRRKKNYPKRNKRIYELYMDKTKHFSINAMAKMFQISS